MNLDPLKFSSASASEEVRLDYISRLKEIANSYCEFDRQCRLIKPTMAKSETKVEPPQAQNGSATHSGAFDPALAALFASSAGPVAAPVKRPRTEVVTSRPPIKTPKTPQTEPDETSSSDSHNSDEDAESESASETSASEAEIEEQKQPPRKRRRTDQNEDLESKYLDKLAREEEQELKQRKKQDLEQLDDAGSDSDLNSDLQDVSDSDVDSVKQDEVVEENENGLPKHESLSKTAHDLETEKLKRTVFLGNVSTSVIKVKADKRTLIAHLRTGLDTKHHEKVESIRFRSAAFVQDAGPKRAAYATKQLMEETMKSTNAYVVTNTEAAARKLAARLNGSIVLDRHLRVDHLGNPSRIDHRRCVFVGNLSFVDEETLSEDVDGETKKRKRAREPADVEEGLWRTFGKCGKVESVRVIRDKETRISKGFAYVQFQDENGVEAALLLDGKKFPPMLPRQLRVSRAKRETKKARDDRGGQRNGTRTVTKGKSQLNGSRPKFTSATGEQRVFEGHRASSNNALPKGLKKLKKRPAVKPDGRSSKRAAAFRAGGGRKKRDMVG